MGRPRKNPDEQPAAPKKKSKLDEVIDNVYYAIKAREMADKTLFPALRKRLTDIHAEIKDYDQLELVCLTILDDANEFNVWKDFNWVYFEMVRDTLEVPEGAWKYALWSYKSKDRKLQETVNAWLGRWYDGNLDRDLEEIAHAQNGLENLWLKHNVVQEIKW